MACCKDFKPRSLFYGLDESISFFTKREKEKYQKEYQKMIKDLPEKIRNKISN